MLVKPFFEDASRDPNSVRLINHVTPQQFKQVQAHLHGIFLGRGLWNHAYQISNTFVITFRPMLKIQLSSHKFLSSGLGQRMPDVCNATPSACVLWPL